MKSNNRYGQNFLINDDTVKKFIEQAKITSLDSVYEIGSGNGIVTKSLCKQAKYVVENTQGVISFVGPKGGTPVPLREEEVKRIFGEVERKDGNFFQ